MIQAPTVSSAVGLWIKAPFDWCLPDILERQLTSAPSQTPTKQSISRSPSTEHVLLFPCFPTPLVLALSLSLWVSQKGHIYHVKTRWLNTHCRHMASRLCDVCDPLKGGTVYAHTTFSLLPFLTKHNQLLMKSWHLSPVWFQSIGEVAGNERMEKAWNPRHLSKSQRSSSSCNQQLGKNRLSSVGIGLLSDEDSTFLSPKEQLELKIVLLNDIETAGARNKQQERQYFECSPDLCLLTDSV